MPWCHKMPPLTLCGTILAPYRVVQFNLDQGILVHVRLKFLNLNFFSRDHPKVLSNQLTGTGQWTLRFFSTSRKIFDLQPQLRRILTFLLKHLELDQRSREILLNSGKHHGKSYKKIILAHNCVSFY